MAIALAIEQLRQEMAMQRQQDQQALQDAIVRLQDNQASWQAWANSVAAIVGPTQDVPKLNLNTRPRY